MARLNSVLRILPRMPPREFLPSRIKRHERTLGTSTRPSIVMTDAGRGYVKARGNPEGDAALVCEWIGTELAGLLAIHTLDHAVVQVVPADVELPVDVDAGQPWASRPKALAGPAFITRSIRATGWDGSERALRAIENPDDFSRLVVLDTWVLNRDRHPRRPPHPDRPLRQPNYDNVLLQRRGSARSPRWRLVAMDFTHILDSQAGELRARYSIDLIQDDGVYGLFPQFESRLYVAVLLATLRHIDQVCTQRQPLLDVLARVPREWGLDETRQAALCEFLIQRGQYLARRFLPNLGALLPGLPGCSTLAEDGRP